MQEIFNNPKTSKIENINKKGKQFNPHTSISTLCLFLSTLLKTRQVLKVVARVDNQSQRIGINHCHQMRNSRSPNPVHIVLLV